MAEQKPHLGEEMKNQIQKEVAEKEKIAEGKKEYDAKKPNLKAEIEKKAQEHEKILEGKKEYDAKKPNLKAEIEKKAQEHEKVLEGKKKSHFLITAAQHGILPCAM